MTEVKPLSTLQFNCIYDLLVVNGMQPLAESLQVTITGLKSENEKLREALSELADLMDDVCAGEYEPDSFTTQPARAALAKG